MPIVPRGQILSDPRPGDEVYGPTLKAKVISITLDESGLRCLSYVVSHRDQKYRGSEIVVTARRWREFIANEEGV